MPDDDIIDGHEAARLLKVNYRTVLKYAEQGLLPAFRVGNLWRFRKSDIEAHIEKQVRERHKEK